MSKSQLQHKKSIENSKILVNCSQKWMWQKYIDVVSLVGMTTPDLIHITWTKKGVVILTGRLAHLTPIF